MKQLICRLDEQQCQQECSHKSDREKCPFVNIESSTPTPVLQSIEGKPIYPLNLKGLEDMLEDFTIDHLKENGYSVGSEEASDITYTEKNRRVAAAYDIILNGIPATLPAKDKTNEAGERK